MKVVDLFCGLGGFHVAFDGIADVVLASEIDLGARRTYQANFPSTNLVGDIREIGALPKHDILCAGFPCQPFSVAAIGNGRNGFLDSRGTLFFEIVRLLKQSQPAAFLLENVPGIIHHDGGRTFATIQRELRESGYIADWHIVNSFPWVAQTRKRVYFRGIRHDNSRFLDTAFGLTNAFILPPTNLEKTPTLGDVLERNVSDRYNLTEAQERSVRKSYKLSGRKGDILKDLNRPTSTLLTHAPARAGRDAIVVDNEGKPRGITPREAARLQGFPDSFVLPESDCQAFKQLGNAVVPPVARAVLESMLPLIRPLLRV